MARYNEENPFISRRIGNIFGGQAQDQDSPFVSAARKSPFASPAVQQVNTSAVTQQDTEEDPILSALKRLQGGQATAAYREHVGKMPRSGDYAPSKTRKIGAALAAAAAAYKNPVLGAQIGEQIVDAPYRNAVESWQMKGAGLKEQANIEKEDLGSQMDYVKMVRQSQLDKEKNALEERKVAADERRAATDEMYRQGQIDNYKRQGWVKDTDNQGNTIMLNPNTGEQKNFGPSMEGRKMTDQERGTRIQGYNADTSRMQAGTAAGQLGLGQQRFNYEMGRDPIEDAQRNRGLDIQQQSADQTGMNAGAAGFMSPGEVFTANATAAQEVGRTDPRFEGWSFDDRGQIVKPGSMWGTNSVDPGSPEAIEFMKAVEAKKQGIVGTRRPGVGAPVRRAPTVPPPTQQQPLKFGDLQPGGAAPDPYKNNRF